MPDPSLFAGKTVLVTGAGTGIGYALCESFAQAGAIVALNDLSPALCHESAQQINAALGVERVYPFVCDVADVTALHAMVQQFVAQVGKLDIVIANAGITEYGAFLDALPERFDRLTGINLRGTFFTAQYAARHMIEQQIAGRILLLSSVTGIQVHKNLGGYGITKAGIQMMAKTIAIEVARYGITVNALCPGAILTSRNVRDDPHFEEHWRSVIPTRRVGQVEDIVAAAHYLASPVARHVTGQTLVVDGGWTLESPEPPEWTDLPKASSLAE